jgi:predicted MFS family arabinose efflux permease
MALLVDRVRGEERGLAVSTCFMDFDIGIGLGTIGLGFVSQAFGWEVMWPTSAACALLGLLGLTARRGEHKHAAQ